jgi:hypothetical protein
MKASTKDKKTTANEKVFFGRKNNRKIQNKINYKINLLSFFLSILLKINGHLKIRVKCLLLLSGYLLPFFYKSAAINNILSSKELKKLKAIYR